MSNQEIDAIVGRLVREKSEALRRQAALEAELKLVERVVRDVLARHHSLSPEEIAGQLEPVRKYFNADAYLELLRERERVGREIVEKINALRDLQVEL